MSARPTRWAAVAGLVAALLALAGCVSIPTGGAVAEGDAQVDEVGGIDLLAEGPQDDAQPQDIVEGFLLAGAAGFADGFVVARQYLAGDARAQWKPLAGVVVAGALDLQQTSDAEITASVPVVARVDEEGRYAEAAGGAAQSVTFGLLQDSDGQWRISSAPDGLILSQPVFASEFRSAPVYFLSPDRTFLVPETRWFPERNLATALLQALLAGPSEWLRDAVTTAVPDGTRLVAGAVVVDATGTATVELAPAPAVLEADRDLLLAQVEATLGIPRVGAVRVVTAEVTLTDPAVLERSVLTTGALEVVRDGTLQQLASQDLTEVPDVGPLPAGARSPARSEDGTFRVALDADGLVTVPAAGDASAVLVPGTDLVAPSVDRRGWAWTARTGGGGELLAAAPDGTVVEVVADWLEDRQVRSVRVARDGTRVAVVSAGADGVAVDVAGVVRDDAGAPRQLGAALRVGATLLDATAVGWVDATTLAVVGSSTGAEALHLVPVSGPTTVEPELEGLSAVASGRGDRNLVVAAEDGALFRLDGPSWVRIGEVTGAADPAYPG